MGAVKTGDYPGKSGQIQIPQTADGYFFDHLTPLDGQLHSSVQFGLVLDVPIWRVNFISDAPQLRGEARI